MSVRSQFNMKGLAAYLEDIARAGADVDQAAEEAVVEGARLIYQSIDEGVPVGKAPEDKHPGNLKRNIKMQPPERSGNQVSVQVGVDPKADKDTLIYGGVQEYGSASSQAQPYIRPAFDKNKSKVRALQRKVLQQQGLI